MAEEAMLRKECIISNTIDVINEKGIQAVSTKEIARRSGISEGTLFKYFPRKSSLIKAVLEHYSQYDDDIFHAAASKTSAPGEALISYINLYAEYYENYPEITVITQSYDQLSSIPEIRADIIEIYNKRLGYIRQLVANAQQAGEIDGWADTELLTDIISSTLRGVCLRWRMRGHGFSLREKLLGAMALIISAFEVDKNIGE